MRVDHVSPQEWDRFVSQADHNDVYFHSSYVQLHAAHEGAEAFFCIAQNGESKLGISGMLCPILGHPNTFDLQTPNGYGGPLTHGSISEEHWSSLAKALAARGIVAGFFRLHPLFDQRPLLPSHAEVREDRVTCLVTFDGGKEGVLARSDWRHRNKVRKAEKAEAAGALQVRWNDPADWLVYQKIYSDAMERKQAVESLRFGPDYFEALQKIPGTHLAMALESGIPTAGHVYLFGKTFAHYHLGARTLEASDWTTSYLMQLGFERAMSEGLQSMHLGGGATTSEDDGVLRFKTSFGGETRNYRVALVKNDEAAFADLIADWEAKRGRKPVWLLGYRQS